MLRPYFQRISHQADRILHSRSEAKTVPNLLVAPSSPTTQSEKEDLYADYPQGYYSNGAYTATPLPQPNYNQAYSKGGQQEDQDPQDAYYSSLRARFTDLTEVLQSPPPRAAPDSTNVHYLDLRRRRLWREKLLNTTPSMVLLAQLTQESVVRGLEVLESLLTFASLRGKKGRNIGAWTWGLLGRCREVGQMGSEEVGVLRDLGKRAVWLLRRISAGEVIGGAADEPGIEMDEDDEEEEEEEGNMVEDRAESVDDVADNGYSPQIDPITTAVSRKESNNEAHETLVTTADADLEKAKRQILDSLDLNQAQIASTGPHTSNDTDAASPQEIADEKARIHATLDMLVTIIGEFYGQRDLLDGRLLWDEMQ